jgi:serine/threonine-protein phosphatase PGAM5
MMIRTTISTVQRFGISTTTGASSSSATRFVRANGGAAAAAAAFSSSSRDSASSSSAPYFAFAALAAAATTATATTIASCELAPAQSQDALHAQNSQSSTEPLREGWKGPRVPYPDWDSNWDDDPPFRPRSSRGKNGITRHVILVRHGQYEEKYDDDKRRVLTPLGREQAKKTGERIAKMISQTNCNVKVVRSSDMSRAIETAKIISDCLPRTVVRGGADPLLAEGRPCANTPGKRSSLSAAVERDGPRIETAFRKYFFRSEENEVRDVVTGSRDSGVVTHKEGGRLEGVKSLFRRKKSSSNLDFGSEPPENHEFEIIVAHGNVIRYFFCRALQLPPESWLRLCTLNCSLTYFTIRSSGTVSCRMMGDCGHLEPNETTFSMHHGLIGSKCLWGEGGRGCLSDLVYLLSRDF